MTKISYNDNFAFDPGTLIMQIVSTNYERDIRYHEIIFSNLVRMVHGKEADYHFGSSEKTFGKNLYTLSIAHNIIQQLNEMLGNGIFKSKKEIRLIKDL